MPLVIMQIKNVTSLYKIDLIGKKVKKAKEWNANCTTHNYSMSVAIMAVEEKCLK
jgi:hypothetical protein